MRPIHLRMGRAALGWTVRELAEKAGVNKNTVSRYESGRQIVSDALMRLEQTLTAEGVVFLENESEFGLAVRIVRRKVEPTFRKDRSATKRKH